MQSDAEIWAEHQMRVARDYAQVVQLHDSHQAWAGTYSCFVWAAIAVALRP